MPARGESCHSRAAEFLLRKDYRADWEVELLEEYTYLSQGEFEGCFTSLGLRVLASTPLSNPWVVTNRFRGRCRVTTPDGRFTEFPPTNYVIVGELVPGGRPTPSRHGREGRADRQVV